MPCFSLYGFAQENNDPKKNYLELSAVNLDLINDTSKRPQVNGSYEDIYVNASEIPINSETSFQENSEKYDLSLIGASISDVDLANDTENNLNEAPVDTTKPRNWELEITPGLVLPFINGDVTFKRIKKDVNIGPGDIIPSLHFATMMRVEFWKKNIGLMAYGDYAISHLKYNRTKPYGLIDSINVHAQQGKLNLAASYRFRINLNKNSDKQLYIEPYVGVVQNYIKGNVIIDKTRRDKDLTKSNYWAETFIGGRIQVPINKKLKYWIRGDIGGFGIGAANHFTSNIQTGIEYKPKKWIGFKLWYYLNTINRSSKRDIGLNLINQGPGFAVSFYP